MTLFILNGALRLTLKNSFKTIIFVFVLSLIGCSSTTQTLYSELGGQTKIDEITDNFIEQIAYNEHIIRYFENSNIDRFREKLNEHLCMVSNGPCEYTGDDMELVHTGMNINENHFNLTVELLIKAMTLADVPHNTQNKVLARLVPMRADIIYK